MKSQYWTYGLLAAMGAAVLIAPTPVCLSANTGTLPTYEALDKAVIQLEDKWKEDQAEVCFGAAGELARTIMKSPPQAKPQTAAIKLFDNLTSKPVNVSKIRAKDLPVKTFLADYLAGHVDISPKEQRRIIQLL